MVQSFRRGIARSLVGCATALAVIAAPDLASAAGCGDGLWTILEGCDDGNVRDGDGCSSACKVEPGFQCEFGAVNLVPLANHGFESALTSSDWKVLTGAVDWLNAGYAACFPAGEGVASIDLNETKQGAIGQAFATSPGGRYTVSFLGNANCVAAAGDSCSLGCSRTVAIGVADDTAADDATDAAKPFKTAEYVLHGNAQVTPWQTVHFEFEAHSSRTLLFFSGTDPSSAGPMIDDVQIPIGFCYPEHCGDGVLDVGEVCDDGNRRSGDGCGADCRHVENDFSCPTPGAPCTTPCGNGKKANIEACDDGNTVDGDGCSHDCTIEAGSSCTVAPPNLKSVCVCAKPGYDASCHDIDECSAGVGGDPTKKACGANQACANAPGAYTCSCKSGYKAGGTPDAYGKADCVDIDECAAPTSPCVADATCTNKPGDYTCQCKPGYSGNGVDSCVEAGCNSTADCPANSVCSAADDPRNPGGIRVCGCNVGYEPDPASTKVLACRSSSKASTKCSVGLIGGPDGELPLLAFPAALALLGVARRLRRRAQRG